MEGQGGEGRGGAPFSLSARGPNWLFGRHCSAASVKASLLLKSVTSTTFLAALFSVVSLCLNNDSLCKISNLSLSLLWTVLMVSLRHCSKPLPLLTIISQKFSNGQSTQ
jgi:hypothetical protein